MRQKIKITLFLFKYTGYFLFLFSIITGITQNTQAQEVFLCVWRNPERTMSRIFPSAHDYRTMTVNISREELETIEKIIGNEVLPGQREQFQYYQMTDREGRILGYIIAVTQRGQYGAVEFVFGLNTEYTVKDLYIQRTRERDRSFRERDFLDLFIGVNIHDTEKIPSLYDGSATPGTEAVINGLIKALTSFDQLVLKK